MNRPRYAGIGSNKVKVEITATAERNRQQLLDGIAKRHSFAVSQRVSDRIIQTISDLPAFPRKWPVEESKRYGKVHIATIDGLTLIFYAFSTNLITVVDITDARSNWQ